ncbi:MAG TPA: hypothetical protein VGB20_00300 [bacterium]
MADVRWTNRLLAGILLALLAHLALHLDRPVQAETFQLDYCITGTIDQSPQQYLHVVAHPAPGTEPEE